METGRARELGSAWGELEKEGGSQKSEDVADPFCGKVETANLRAQ